MSMEDLFGDAEVISAYTREQAIEDGVLIDVTVMAKEAGFKIPAVVTQSVWDQCVKVPDGLEGQGQDEQGRLWDVVWLASLAARRTPAGENRAAFRVSVVDGQTAGGFPHRMEHELWLHVGPGDHGEPVITIMAPGDD